MWRSRNQQSQLQTLPMCSACWVCGPQHCQGARKLEGHTRLTEVPGTAPCGCPGTTHVRNSLAIWDYSHLQKAVGKGLSTSGKSDASDDKSQLSLRLFTVQSKRQDNISCMPVISTFEPVVQHRAECGVKSSSLKKTVLCNVSGHTVWYSFFSTLRMSYFFIFKEQKEGIDEFLKLQTDELWVREMMDTTTA